MDVDAIVSFLHGWILLLATFAIALGYSMFKGRQNLINLIMGSYLALLLLNLAPHLDSMLAKTGGEKQQAIATIGLFLILTFLATWLFTRLMPREFLEGAFESIGKKLLLSVATMILVMTLITHYLPVSDIVNIGTPLPVALLSEKFAFLWLVLPLVVLFFV